jgi:hypothetical protein
MHVFTAALRAGDLALFVFCKGKDDFEWLLAVFAEEFVTRQVALKNATIRSPCKPKRCITGNSARRRLSVLSRMLNVVVVTKF